jgi:hypothetical protein
MVIVEIVMGFFCLNWLLGGVLVRVLLKQKMFYSPFRGKDGTVTVTLPFEIWTLHLRHEKIGLNSIDIISSMLKTKPPHLVSVLYYCRYFDENSFGKETGRSSSAVDR